MFYNASNNAWSRLSSAISASATSLTVQGGNWPEPPFLISIEDEIIEINNKSGNTFSDLVRGMEGTTPAPHPANARVENRFTAGTYSLLKDVLTDSRIVEHNLTVSDPSNGWYIRWNNGLQICWHVLNLGPGNAHGNGTLSNIYRTGANNFYFPAVFIVSPKAFLTPHYTVSGGGNNIVFSASYRDITNLGVISIQAIMGASVSDDIFVDVLTVGRWK